MATPTIPYATSANTGSTTKTSQNITTSNTFSGVALAAMFTRVVVTGMNALLGGNAMTLVGGFTHPSDTHQIWVFKYAIPTTLVNPTMAFSWTGSARGVAMVCEVNNMDPVNGLTNTGTASGADLTIEAADSPTADQRWVNFMACPGNSSATITVDADHTQHVTDVSTNATGSNNVRATLSSRVGTGAALSDVHTVVGPASINWILYRLRLSGLSVSRIRSPIMVG